MAVWLFKVLLSGGSIFGISPVIGLKSLNRLASGILRVHGEEQAKPAVFVLVAL